MLSWNLLLTIAVTGQINDYPYRVGSTHWHGCYNLTTKPYLIEGVEAITQMGSKVVKLAMTNPNGNYLWNSDWEANLNTPLSIAQSSYFKQVFAMNNIDTFILVTFSSLGDAYWRNGVTQSQYNQEQQEYYELTLYLLTNYVSSKNKTFVLQNWEGDWAVRGNYNKSSMPTQTAIDGMIEWYSARQSGVDKARREYWSMNVDMDHNVYMAGEVNLVVQSMNSNPPFPNTIVSVIPYVSLDFISYSSYDSQCESYFEQSLQYISNHHNKTDSSPTNAVYIGEYGLKQMHVSMDTLQQCVMNVVNVSYNFGCPFIMFWQVYGNECTSCPNGKCTTQTGPIYNANDLNGFWLIEPNATIAWPYTYFQSLYNQNDYE